MAVSALLLGAIAITAPVLRSDSAAQTWSKDDLIEPDALARMLVTPAKSPKVICVAFPVLYRQKHIAHAEFAGPGSKPQALEALRQAVAKLPKGSEIVIYCGCCPMAQCPNVGPAFRTLKDMGYKRVRILDLPVNFHNDWTAKGYPVE